MAHAYLGAKPGRASDEKYTPQWVLDQIDLHFGGIELDPCWHPNSLVCPMMGLGLGGCLVRGLGGVPRVVEPKDGLAEMWHELVEPGGRRPIFVNPPYSNMVEWAKKVVAEANEGCEIILLTNASVETAWCQDLIWPNATAIVFPRRRLRFVGEVNDNPWPTMLTYFGRRAERFLQAFADEGRGVYVFPSR